MVTFVSDVRNHARHAADNAEGLSADVMALASETRHAALYRLIIGEAPGSVSVDVKSAAPHIPWRKISDLRNIPAHADRQVDLETIAGVIENRVRLRIEDLRGLIELSERSET